MVGRTILPKKGKLRILIDSRSLASLLTDGNREARNLLKYSTCEPFEFIRSPIDTDHEELKVVQYYIERYDEKNNLTAIEIPDKSITAFWYKMQDIEDIGRYLYNKQTLSLDEKEVMLLVFIQAELSGLEHKAILLTENKMLLRNRQWFESHFPGCPLNIATIDETKEIMDLFAKYNNTYLISSHFTCNKWLWYWYSFRSKIPNYNVGDYILDALASRFVYLLMSVDEMGFQYYSGVNNDLMENMIYHFNYCISLVSGVFDNLAIASKNRLGLAFRGASVPARTSLNPKAGKEFLKALERENNELHKHITNHTNFVNLIYSLRELVTHREMLPKTTFENRNEKWKAMFITVDTNVAGLIRQSGDMSQDYEPVTLWGKYELAGENHLEPFHFSKAAASLLASFCNTYLRLLGYSDFLETREKQNKKDDFVRTVKTFMQGSLGF